MTPIHVNFLFFPFCVCADFSSTWLKTRTNKTEHDANINTKKIKYSGLQIKTLENGRFYCPHETCFKTFSRRDHVSRHYNTSHLGLKKNATYCCPHENCTETFSRKDHVDRHCKRKHPGISAKSSCSKCELVFEDNRAKQEHEKTCKGRPFFFCGLGSRDCCVRGG